MKPTPKVFLGLRGIEHWTEEILKWKKWYTSKYCEEFYICYTYDVLRDSDLYKASYKKCRIFLKGKMI